MLSTDDKEELNKTISDILQAGLFVTEKIDILENKLVASQRENEELTRQLKTVNRKPQDQESFNVRHPDRV